MKKRRYHKQKIIQRFHYRRMQRYHPVFLWVIALSICATTFFLTANLRLRPLISEIAEAKARYIATRAINDAVSEELEENSEEYKNIILFEKDDKNQILAVKTDIIKINTLKSRVIARITDHLGQVESSVVLIPIGNLVKGDIFYGRGPRIAVKLMPLGSASANFLSVFTNAGINQTRHQIIIETHVDMSMLLPGASAKVEVTSQVSIAETVLIGSVPKSYTYIEDADDEATEKYFNLQN